MGAGEDVSPFPGAKQFSDQIFMFEYSPRQDLTSASTQETIHVIAPEAAAASSADRSTDPTTIIIFGWGDGQAKHVSKYITGYRALFPAVERIVVVLATTFKAAYQPLDERVRGMMPVIDAAFPDGPIPIPVSRGSSSPGTTTDAEVTVDASTAASPHSHVLLHAMSNAGGINLASALHAYKSRFGAPMPHRLLVLDSTPGGVVFREQVGRWARAMAIGMSRQFPWPYIVTYVLCYVFLWLMKGYEWLLRRHHAGAYSRAAVNQAGDIIAVPASRLYMYSREDDIILWKDVEVHAAQARGLGSGVDLKEFQGSEHVGHMRRHPREYWGAVAESWAAAG